MSPTLLAQAAWVFAFEADARTDALGVARSSAEEIALQQEANRLGKVADVLFLRAIAAGLDPEKTGLDYVFLETNERNDDGRE